jgi:hypothetical protein
VQPIAVVLDDNEIAMLVEAQRWLRQLLGRMENTIESNPSSNLLTSDLSVLGEHPALQLTLGTSARRPLRLARVASRSSQNAPLLVSINTDDPITFATRLADEYAYLYFALLQKKYTAQEALAWVERVRMAGWRSRFTIPASSDGITLERLAKRWRHVLKLHGRRRRPKVEPIQPEEEELTTPEPEEETQPSPLEIVSQVQLPLFSESYGWGSIHSPLGLVSPWPFGGSHPSRPLSGADLIRNALRLSRMNRRRTRGR